MPDTMERIRKLFLENFDLPADRLHPDATIESVGLDSLDKIEFMFALEQEFDIKIPDREVRLDSIRDMVSVIERLVVEQHAGLRQEA